MTGTAILERGASGWAPPIRYLGVGLSVAGLVVAASAEVWGSPGELPGPLIVTAAVLVYVGLLANWHAAVDRVSGAPTVWFTAIVPAVIAVQAVVVEAVNAYWAPFDASGIAMPLLLVAVVVTLVGAHRSGRRWRAGLLAWSLALCHVGLSIGALAGIPLGTFGDLTRSDELLVWGAVLPLLGMAIAFPFAPRTPWPTRLAGPVLVAAVLPASLVSGTVVAGFAVLAVLSLVTVTVGAKVGSRLS